MAPHSSDSSQERQVPPNFQIGELVSVQFPLDARGDDDPDGLVVGRIVNIYFDAACEDEPEGGWTIEVEDDLYTHQCAARWVSKF